jgi:cell division protein FtsB
MPEPRSYRIILWSLVIFVLVVATPGWYIQKQLAQKMHLMDDRLATLEEQVEELKSEHAKAEPEDSGEDDSE